MRAFDEAGAQMFGNAADIFSVRLPPGSGSQRLDMQALLMQIPKERRALWTATAGDLDSLLGSLPGPVSYVEYDLERWPQTPKSEQDNPVAAVQQAQQVAHAHGAQLLLTPTSYFNDKYGDQLARYTDIYVPQAKAYEAGMSTDQYQQTVGTLLKRLRAANPSVKVFLDISPEPKGIAKTGQEMLQDVNLVRSVAPIDGVWITYRPREEPTVTQFLQLLGKM
jgi:hypothetical protein